MYIYSYEVLAIKSCYYIITNCRPPAAHRCSFSSEKITSAILS